MDLYPGYYFVRTESKSMHADWITSKEFVVTPPTHLGKTSLVFICSHGGNTKETVEAAYLSRERGAAVVTMTHDPSSACNDDTMYPIVYDWADTVNEKDKPQGIVLHILNELMKVQEPDYQLYDAVAAGPVSYTHLSRNSFIKAIFTMPSLKQLVIWAAMPIRSLCTTISVS